MDSTESIRAKLETILTTTPAVVAARTDMTAAIESERAAFVALIEAAILAVKPALPAITQKPKVASRIYWVDNACTAETVTRAEWRGVCVTDSSWGPTEKDGRGNSGSYEGTDVFLTANGLIELTYEGHWSRWQGAATEWSAMQRPLTVPEFVVEYENAAARLVSHLADALARQAGDGMAKRAAQARATAEKFAALTCLLRK